MNIVHQQERHFSKRRDLFNYFAGFVEGEGCFSVSIKPFAQMKHGWMVDPMFSLYQHEKNRNILELFQSEMHCGYIVKEGSKPEVLVYIVDNRRTLEEVIIPFFNKYGFLGTKKNDFLIFQKIISMMSQKLHLEKEGLIEIVKLAFQMNQQGKGRKYTAEQIISSLNESSETTR
ncbi:hypothetical protein CO168_00090 [Candidatus Shapirobacteria bacterium CG_4_9_14_3_um_filter_36_12]|uniref:Homing endonuclease LAGLIDADG domain-containing protein n=2 Tax=Candidatus Shapironibacteriota TaxID=1752721 RepID=A0A1J5I9K5_9BACT|nr:MAG: hypothetical protein AUK05_00080 [Candidatus Shapirobacteria bacterium CG2_30_35_20]PJA51376.1 MAG: hypothetical protein CO168_00090 [Candidatus Shapirobacteria bacterium CG_4_9_14_3_um_filter_36_12]